MAVDTNSLFASQSEPFKKVKYVPLPSNCPWIPTLLTFITALNSPPVGWTSKYHPKELPYVGSICIYAFAPSDAFEVCSIVNITLPGERV